MSVSTPNIQAKRPEIRQLSDNIANRIAAGEVVERPASAVKELVENSIDAGATHIDIAYSDGGKTLIKVVDNGIGIPRNELPLALSRHATSKIEGHDLLNIHTFGFRGEALPSLGAVGRLAISSRVEGETGFEITAVAGEIGEVKPAALSVGTVVELRDLFFATPARLKFLRSDRAEAQAISEVVKRLAMAEPGITFVLRDVSSAREARVIFRADAETGDLFSALSARLSKILGKEFVENSVQIDASREEISMLGMASLPTYSRGAAVAQYIFVNGRPVKDKMLLGAMRSAYSDFLHRGRHPVVALFLECDPTRVDVNVHPAKSEVRFREPGIARGLIVSGLRHALAGAGHRASSTVADAALGKFQPEETAPRIYQMDREQHMQPVRPSGPTEQMGFAETQTQYSGRVEEAPAELERIEARLGAARAQLHENYIIAQTKDGIVIVDQHAAHERLVYEKLKRQMAQNKVPRQALLIPEIVQYSDEDRADLLRFSDNLAELGLVIEEFGGAIAIRELPALLGDANPAHILADVLDEIKDQASTANLQERLEAILSRIACHGSIRSGRRMRAEEMDALLREMEATPHSGQCNHGRPTYVELKLADIEKLFGRR